MKIVEEIKKNWKKILVNAGIAVGCGIMGYVIGKKRNKENVRKTNYYYKHDKYYKK